MPEGHANGEANGERASPERIEPIVLVGGKSRRFGRDKLREPVARGIVGDSPMPDGVLVERSIEALRDVFGARVTVVGDCHQDVVHLGDFSLRDRYPGRGPAGGILCALEHFRCAVFVLAGDLSQIDGKLVAAICELARTSPCADAIVAAAGTEAEPCIGIYRLSAIPALTHAIAQPRSLPMRSVLERLNTRLVDAPHEQLRNVNQPADLAIDGSC